MQAHFPCLPLQLVLLLFGVPGVAVVSEEADVVLDCWYIEDGGGLSAVSRGFSREKALLVLRNVPVEGNADSATWTDYEVREGDKEHPIFEVIGSEVAIPDGEILLHADCEGREVTCEISSFETAPATGLDEGSSSVAFLGGLRVAGSGLGMAMLFRTIPVEQDESRVQSFNERLNVELSPTGTIPLSLQFIVYTRTASIQTSLGSSVLLDCGFLGSEPSTVTVEWRLQYKGAGRTVFTLVEGKGATEREGTSMDADMVASQGNVSLLLHQLTIQDEGTYICIVQGARGHAQHTVQLEIMEPPHVFLSPSVLYFHEGLRESLTCVISRYYPLDVTVKWSVQSEGEDLDSQPLTGVSFSSHRRNKDGTYNISSHVFIAPGAQDVGAVYTCEVTHVTLGEPAHVSIQLQTPTGPEEGVLFAKSGIVISSILFVLALIHFFRRSSKPPGPKDGTG
ncbi:tapasin-related protein-like [Mustelus asterias]